MYQQSPRQNGSHYVDIYQGIFLNENVRVSNKLSKGCVSQWSNGQQVSIGSGNGLVPWGNKPLLEPVLTKIHNTMGHHWDTMSQADTNFRCDNILNSLNWVVIFINYTLKKGRNECILNKTVWKFNTVNVSELGSIGSGNGLSPVRRQAITWTNVELLLIRPLGTHLSEIRIKIQYFLFMKMHLQMSSAKWPPLCLGGEESLFTDMTVFNRLMIRIEHSSVWSWEFNAR